MSKDHNHSRMTPAQVDSLGYALIVASDAFQAQGGRIVARTFGHRKRKCPIACLVDARPPPPHDQTSDQKLTAEVSRVMGFPVSTRELWALIFTFDSGETTFYQEYPEVCQLALDLRYKYLHVLEPGPMPVLKIQTPWWQRLLYKWRNL